MPARTETDLVAVVPELRFRTLTYDVDAAYGAPKEDHFLVSLGSKSGKVGTVYQIASATLIQAKKPRDFNRWKLKVLVTEGMKDKVEVYQFPNRHVEVVVDGRIGWPCYWNSRDKKSTS